MFNKTFSKINIEYSMILQKTLIETFWFLSEMTSELSKHIYTTTWNARVERYMTLMTIIGKGIT